MHAKELIASAVNSASVESRPCSPRTMSLTACRIWSMVVRGPMLAGNADKNLGTRFRKIIQRAGVEVWPKPFQNCRASRQTELEQQFPTYVVCAWLGNMPTVAHKHYLTVTADHFSEAANTGDKLGTQTPVLSRTDSQPKPAQSTECGRTRVSRKW